MSQFEDRQKGQEAKYAFDAEKKFKAEARRNKLLGLWAAEKLGISGDAGHINVQSGHGPWPEGLLMFTRLMQRI